MFTRRSMEQILDSMIGWSRGVTDKLTDYRIGSRTRTLFETFAVQIEELEDRFFRATRIQIAENIYAIFDFERMPAAYGSGFVTFGRATAADKDYTIYAGTIVQKASTSSEAAISFRTLEDVVLKQGDTTVSVGVVCTVAGTIGNVAEGEITVIPVKPTGVDTVTNQTGFITGAEEETADSQKARFQKFIEAQARGVIQAVKYGAGLAFIEDSSGIITERVMQAEAFEYLPERKGEVDVYVWNGVGTASAALLEAVRKVLYGYYTDDGRAVYGYKPAGVNPFIYSATPKNIKVKMALAVETGKTEAEVKELIEPEIDSFMAEMAIGSKLYQTAMESMVKGVDGVKDVKLSISTDGGSTWTDQNITPNSSEIIYLLKPLIYS